MPVRIKPILGFGPCLLDLCSIKIICKLVDDNFKFALYTGEDGIWEIYNENSTNFISAITAIDDLTSKPIHKRLDTFIIEAKSLPDEPIPATELFRDRRIRIVFSKKEATVKFSGPTDSLNWFNHFLEDLKKNFKTPTIRQRLNFDRLSNDSSPLAFPPYSLGSLAGTIGIMLFDLILLNRAPYCLIILYKPAPNPMVENVKAGIITNIIWAILILIGGMLLGIIGLMIWQHLHVNINEIKIIPPIPTYTLTP